MDRNSISERTIAAVSLIVANEIRARHIAGDDYSHLLDAYTSLRRSLPKDNDGKRLLQEEAHKFVQGLEL